MPSLSSATKDTIQSTLDNATRPESGLAGLVFVAVDKSGQYLTQQYSGHRSLARSTPMDADTVFHIASCTKMLTGIACMQLVDEGKLDLDSSEQLYKVCPEIKEKKVLQEGGELVDRKGEITTRMLLAHTAGFGYSFFNKKLNDYGLPAGYDEFAGDEEDYLEMPLVNQPGERWEYGINIDWAGILVSRIAGKSLDDYFKEHIFEPIGAKDISFIPSKHMRENLATMQQRRIDGSTVDADHVGRRLIWHAERKDGKPIFQAGGGGCFAKPAEYCKIIAALLNDGVSPTTSNRILSKAAIDEMFKNQIPQFPDFDRQGIEPVKAWAANPAPDLYPQGGNPPQGWGLTFMLTLKEGETGRGANTAFWAGIVNLYWWADRERGIGGMIAGQLLPFGDLEVGGAWFGCEKAVYDGLEN